MYGYDNNNNDNINAVLDNIITLESYGFPSTNISSIFFKNNTDELLFKMTINNDYTCFILRKQIQITRL